MFREARKINELGRAQLVTVDELEKEFRHTLSVKRKMLVCPDCNEYVAFVYCKSKNSYFMHEKSDGTRKCEIYVKRESSNQTNTPYERAGLPLYLLKMGSSFCLNIGFYPISKQAIDAAVVNKLFLKISTDKGVSVTIKYINEESFSSDTTSFIQIDKISSKYKLEFSDGKLPLEISKKWVGEIEGIESKGAFFKFNEYGGLKVRKTEPITVGLDYYLVCKDDPTKSFDGLVCKQVGKINLIIDNCGQSTFGVYAIKFTIITKRNKFVCLECYGNLLVYDSPELNPLWPPCNKKEQLYIYEYEQNAKFLFKMSEQSEKNVFVHPDKQTKIIGLDEKRSIASLSVDSIERPVSIGRSNDIFAFIVVARDSKKMVFSSEVIAEDDKDKTYLAGEHTELPHNNRIKIKTNFIGTVYVYYYDDLEYKRHFDDSIWLNDIRYGSIVKIFHGLDLVSEFVFKRAIRSRKNELEENLNKEFMSHIGSEVFTPISFRYILPRLVDKPTLYEYAKKAIRTGYINKKAKYAILRYIYPNDQGARSK